MGKLNADSASSLDKVEYLVDLFGGLSIVARGLVASRSSPGNNLLSAGKQVAPNPSRHHHQSRRGWKQHDTRDGRRGRGRGGAVKRATSVTFQCMLQSTMNGNS